MTEAFGDLWELSAGADAICVTTNGTVAMSGRGVMGKGCAKEARQRFPNLEQKLGELLKVHGNTVTLLVPASETQTYAVYTFPVKRQWHYKAELELIHRSACQLMGEIVTHGYTRVLLPRPGCGNGGLDWADVKPIIEPVLDDRVIVIDRVPC